MHYPLVFEICVKQILLVIQELEHNYQFDVSFEL